MNDRRRHKQNGVTSQRIILQLNESVKSEDQEHAVKLMENDQLGPWSKLLKLFPGLKVRARWKTRKSGEIAELIAKARELDPA
ncbi:MAG: hypothetical protein MI892_19785, partial [Desulfobacterales bacterium]|nr:hypothetical protein [Desulfobacterales bacterium]